MILMQVSDYKKIQVFDSLGVEKVVGGNPLGVAEKVLGIGNPAIHKHSKGLVSLHGFQQNGIPVPDVDKGYAKHS